MRIKIPCPVSGGLLLSHKCNATCTQCMYACSPRWAADWISEEALTEILGILADKIQPSIYGPDYIDLSHGLHYTGGEPFLNFELLCKAVEIGEEMGIPSTFVETNGFWATDNDTTREKLEILKKKGLKGIMFSINPFYLEYVPFERTQRGIEIGYEVFGPAMIPYQLEYYRKFKEWGITGTVPFEDYLKYESRQNFARNAEFFLSGRCCFRIEEKLPGFFRRHGAQELCAQPCQPDFLRPWHNHFDNYGHYMPGYCGGISLGHWRDLDEMIEEGVEVEPQTPLWFLMKGDFNALLAFAGEHGYERPEEGYLSKCHLCADVRRHLAGRGDFQELQPRAFYENL